MSWHYLTAEADARPNRVERQSVSAFCRRGAGCAAGGRTRRAAASSRAAAAGPAKALQPLPRSPSQLSLEFVHSKLWNLLTFQENNHKSEEVENHRGRRQQRSWRGRTNRIAISKNLTNSHRISIWLMMYQRRCTTVPSGSGKPNSPCQKIPHIFANNRA